MWPQWPRLPDRPAWRAAKILNSKSSCYLFYLMGINVQAKHVLMTVGNISKIKCGFVLLPSLKEEDFNAIVMLIGVVYV